MKSHAANIGQRTHLYTCDFKWKHTILKIHSLMQMDAQNAPKCKLANVICPNEYLGSTISGQDQVRPKD